MKWAALLLMSGLALAEPPKEVLALLRAAAEDLANQDADSFLDKFDHKMAGYQELHDEIEGLVAASDVSSSIEIVDSDGDGDAQTLELDWVLQVDTERPRRQVVKCKIERQGKKWKITSLEPIQFFKK